MDHFIPRGGGGQDNIENLQPLCAHFNRVKGDWPQEYLGQAAGIGDRGVTEYAMPYAKHQVFKDIMLTEPKDLDPTLAQLRPLIDRMRAFEVDDEFDCLLGCLKSAIAKAFQFAEIASEPAQENAFFVTPALRSITEDLLFLNFISRTPEAERKLVMLQIMELEVGEKSRYQEAFFRTFRPFQQRLPERRNDAETLKTSARAFWSRHGWPRFGDQGTRYIPPIREMALKSEPGLLEIVYDFIYRLTSSAVHFEVSGLLRLGLGESPKSFRFNPRVVSRYNHQVNLVYGVYLLSLYFELFSEYFDFTAVEQNAVQQLRRQILQIPRWPEMMTFEDMNFPMPEEPRGSAEMIRAAYAVILEQGFIAGSKVLLGAK